MQENGRKNDIAAIQLPQNERTTATYAGRAGTAGTYPNSQKDSHIVEGQCKQPTPHSAWRYTRI